MVACLQQPLRQDDTVVVLRLRQQREHLQRQALGLTCFEAGAVAALEVPAAGAEEQR